MNVMYKYGHPKKTEFNFIPQTRTTKMKLLSVLLFCFVSVSHQENNVRPPVPYARQSRARYVPLFYSNGVPAGYDFIDDNKAEEILPRNNINETPLGRLFNNILTPISNLITRTSTITSTVVSTVTTATYTHCLPTEQFKIAVPATTTATPAVTEVRSTAVCARRRRDVAEFLIKGDSDVDIHPAEPLPIEASAVVDTPSEMREIQPTQAELLSSKSDELVENPEVRQGLNANAATKLVTVFTTSYTFVPKTLTVTATLAADEGLLCRPAGYALC
ncbi:uncharacterized protein LOC130700748 [Daphnia carinata]|uniref:uncharacterized protein LOC130700748 n=1 Tax=Daphnia carinata TaxID=120202 RepID=UPI00257C99AD|nr:uncharacterized protein LOC130700748 [Daphnia carinata]